MSMSEVLRAADEARAFSTPQQSICEVILDLLVELHPLNVKPQEGSSNSGHIESVITGDKQSGPAPGEARAPCVLCWRVCSCCDVSHRVRRVGARLGHTFQRPSEKPSGPPACRRTFLCDSKS